MKFYKVMALPIDIYGSEIWAVRERQEQKIETAEIKYLRSVAGYTRNDRH